MSLFERLGGEPVLRAILTDFYARIFADPMIGYLFTGLSPERLVELEFQFTARALGADVPYEGRGMRAAHDRHPITRGHFNRRSRLLLDVLVAHGVDPEVRDAWLAHIRRLEGAVLGPVAGRADCDPAPTGEQPPSLTLHGGTLDLRGRSH